MQAAKGLDITDYGSIMDQSESERREKQTSPHKMLQIEDLPLGRAQLCEKGEGKRSKP